MSRQPPLRSVLLSVGADEALLRQNLSCGADVVCLDLEDTVEDKVHARAMAAELLGGSRSDRRGLRINPFSEEDGLRDILMLREARWRPDVIVLTKVLDPFELRQAAMLLPPCDLIALIETAEAVENALAIARAAPNLRALMFGGKDLAHSLGSARNWDALLYGRGRVMNAAAAAGLAALDENFRPLDDLDGLRASSLRSRDLGYCGRLTISARHVPVLHSVFTSPQHGASP